MQNPVYCQIHPSISFKINVAVMFYFWGFLLLMVMIKKCFLFNTNFILQSPLKFSDENFLNKVFILFRPFRWVNL